jgi:hypothetical protein
MYLSHGHGMWWLTKWSIALPYNKNHDNTDGYYPLTVWKKTELTPRLPLHHSSITRPSCAYFTRLYNSDLSVVLHKTYIFLRCEYNHITAYTRTPQSIILRHQYYNTPRHTRIRVPTAFSWPILAQLFMTMFIDYTSETLTDHSHISS